MATVVWRNALCAVNGVDLSADVSELTFNYKADTLDETAMGDDTHVHKGGGLKDWSFNVTFHQDFRASGVDATLYTLVGTTACIEVRPTNACSTATNPIYSGISVLESYNPVGGAVGTLLNAPAVFVSAGSLNRASSS